jgi:prephenate dehydrogenase
MSVESMESDVKDAEVERLKGQVKGLQEKGFHDQVELLRLTGEMWKEIALAWQEQTEKRDKLITELADALEKANPTDRYRTLIQRAKKATR